MNRKTDLYSRNLRLARTIFGIGKQQILLKPLEHLSAMHFDIGSGDLALLNNHWYVTHTGLLRMAKRKKCPGIEVEAAVKLSQRDSSVNVVTHPVVTPLASAQSLFFAAFAALLCGLCG